ncbi:MAG: hypothetical protein KAI70_06780, partial [Candidatus Omnitrophica bacterium]|nr:hypothetical protein [Candidatus Omnitrophota bacterium]
IIIGTIVLSLPIATSTGERLSLTDSLFTATSATCVTGLTVMDTGRSFSSFGKWVIFILFQAGGLGIMTFSTLFAVMLGRKIRFQETDVIKSTLDKHNILGLKKLITYILSITLIVEVIGALSLFLRWRTITDWNLPVLIERSVFHSVSAFCNAGFSLFQTSLEQFRVDPYINITMMSLIIVGGIGFIVIMDIMGLFIKKAPPRKLSVHSKIVLTMSGVLIVAGAIFLLVFEKDSLMKMMTWPEKIYAGLFQSVTARTAGFNTLNIGKLTTPSMVIIMFLMFIGASPGSTGGGIKTCTFAVIAATVLAMLKSQKRVKMFGRSIPKQIIRESLVIFFLAASWIFIVTIILTYFGGNFTSKEGSLTKALFEVVSAFGTVGLSTGITEGLSDIGKICISMTMFAGRVGTLTLALAIAFKERKDKYIYPEENVMVG